MIERMYQESCFNCGADEVDVDPDDAIAHDEAGDALCGDCGADRTVFLEHLPDPPPDPPGGGS